MLREENTNPLAKGLKIKGIVVYDTSYGNTKTIAETIAETVKESGIVASSESRCVRAKGTA